MRDLTIQTWDFSALKAKECARGQRAKGRSRSPNPRNLDLNKLHLSVLCCLRKQLRHHLFSLFSPIQSLTKSYRFYHGGWFLNFHWLNILEYIDQACPTLSCRKEQIRVDGNICQLNQLRM